MSTQITQQEIEAKIIEIYTLLEETFKGKDNKNCKENVTLNGPMGIIILIYAPATISDTKSPHWTISTAVSFGFLSDSISFPTKSETATSPSMINDYLENKCCTGHVFEDQTFVAHGV